MNTYFVQAEGGGPIKIGRTNAGITTRLRDLQAGSPVPLVVVGELPIDVEAMLHFEFESDRLHGEWFRPSPVLLNFIHRLCGPMVVPTFTRNEITRPEIDRATKILDRYDAIYQRWLETGEDGWRSRVHPHPGEVVAVARAAQNDLAERFSRA